MSNPESLFRRQETLYTDRDLCLRIDFTRTIASSIFGPRVSKWIARNMLRRLGTVLLGLGGIIYAFHMYALFESKTKEYEMALSVMWILGVLYPTNGLIMMQPDILFLGLRHFETVYLVAFSLVFAICTADILGWSLSVNVLSMVIIIVFVCGTMMDAWPVSFRELNDQIDYIKRNLTSEDQNNLEAGSKRMSASEDSPSRKSSGRSSFVSTLKSIKSMKSFKISAHMTPIESIRAVKNMYSKLVDLAYHGKSSDTKEKTIYETIHRFFQKIILVGYRGVFVCAVCLSGPIIIYTLTVTSSRDDINVKEIHILNRILTTDGLLRGVLIILMVFYSRRIYMIITHPLKMNCMSRKLVSIPLVSAWDDLLRSKSVINSGAFVNLAMKYMDESPSEYVIYAPHSQNSYAVQGPAMICSEVIQEIEEIEEVTEVEEVEPEEKKEVNEGCPIKIEMEEKEKGNQHRPMVVEDMDLNSQMHKLPDIKTQGNVYADDSVSPSNVPHSTFKTKQPEKVAIGAGTSCSSKVPCIKRNKVIPNLSSRPSIINHSRHAENAWRSVIPPEPKRNSMAPNINNYGRSGIELDRIVMITTPFNEEYVVDNRYSIYEKLLGIEKATWFRKKTKKYREKMIYLSIITNVLFLVDITIQPNEYWTWIATALYSVCIIQLVDYLLTFSNQGLIRCFFSFENIFCLVSAINAAISFLLSCEHLPIRHILGITLFSLSATCVIFIDARPISYAIFDRKLRKITRLVEENLEENINFAIFLHNSTNLIRKHLVSAESNLRELYLQNADYCHNQIGRPRDFRTDFFRYKRASLKDAFWFRYQIMGLFSHLNWIGMLFVFLTTLSFNLLIELNMVNHFKPVQVQFAGVWDTSNIIRSCVFNVCVVMSRRLFGYWKDPTRCLSLDRRVIKVPYVSALRDFLSPV